MARVVLDANVIVSATFGGTPLKAVVEAFRHEVIVSPSIKKELLSLPQALKKKLSPDKILQLEKWLKILVYKAVLHRPRKRLKLCRDSKDDAYLSLCLSANASYLITGDRDLLCLSQTQLSSAGLPRLLILTPKAFLSLPTVRDPH